MKPQCKGGHELCCEVVYTTMQKIQKRRQASIRPWVTAKNLFRKQDCGQMYIKSTPLLLKFNFLKNRF